MHFRTLGETPLCRGFRVQFVYFKLDNVVPNLLIQASESTCIEGRNVSLQLFSILSRRLMNCCFVISEALFLSSVVVILYRFVCFYTAKIQHYFEYPILFYHFLKIDQNTTKQSADNQRVNLRERCFVRAGRCSGRTTFEH